MKKLALFALLLVLGCDSPVSPSTERVLGILASAEEGVILERGENPYFEVTGPRSIHVEVVTMGGCHVERGTPEVMQREGYAVVFLWEVRAIARECSSPDRGRAFYLYTHRLDLTFDQAGEVVIEVVARSRYDEVTVVRRTVRLEEVLGP